jgi:hypothetical protein
MELLHPIVHKMAVDSIRRMIIPRLRFLMYRQKALSILARIKGVYPASPTSDQGGVDQKQPSGIGSGGGAPSTGRLPPIWIRRKDPSSQVPSGEELTADKVDAEIDHKNPISEVPPGEELTADKADAEIHQIRSTWKSKSIPP